MPQRSRSVADDLYDREVRHLPLKERLHLMERIVADASTPRTGSSRQRSLLELEGLGADLRKGVDAQEYVTSLRREWDHRP